MEYRKRCKVCGAIWCYTDKDLGNDAVDGVVGVLNAVGGIASAFGGNVFQQKMFSDRMENDRRRQVNRDQCPNCRSLDTEYYFGEELKETQKIEEATVAQISINSNATIENRLIRAKNLLEDKEWASANAYCDNVLDEEPENGTAYLYKLMAELQVSEIENLKEADESFEEKANYKKVVRFAKEDVKRVLAECLEYIKERKEQEKEDTYNALVEAVEKEDSALGFAILAEAFETMLDYKDSAKMHQICMEKAEEGLKDIKKENKKWIAIIAVCAVVFVVSMAYIIFG